MTPCDELVLLFLKHTQSGVHSCICIYLRAGVETVDVVLVLVAKVLGVFNLQPFEIDFEVLETAKFEVLKELLAEVLKVIEAPGVVEPAALVDFILHPFECELDLLVGAVELADAGRLEELDEWPVVDKAVGVVELMEREELILHPFECEREALRETELEVRVKLEDLLVDADTIEVVVASMVEDVVVDDCGTPY